MSIPTISTLPTPPTRSDAANFAVRADAFMAALPTFQSQTNAAIGAINALYYPPVFRNKIINGACEIAQRGTSFTGATVGTVDYPVDRFLFTGAGTSAVVTLSQQTDAPASNPGLQRSLRVAVTTADAAVATGDAAGIQQNIEGYSITDLIGQTFTVSFWVRSAVTGTHCVAMFNDGINRSYVATYSIAAANTWEFKTITVTGGLPTAGTWNYTNGRGLAVRWSLMAGATYQNTAGTWHTGNFLGTSAQVNVLATVGNVFALTGVQVERGTGTAFEFRPLQVELALCERYAELVSGVALTTQYATFPFRVSKRSGSVSISLLSLVSGSGLALASVDSNAIYQSTGNSAVSSFVAFVSAEL